MATVTEPIALDRSLNTTEQTPRNLADVLAQALQALNTTISGLNFINCVVVQTLPTADISTTTIYLVPKNPAQTDNLYDEYINLTGTSAGWEKIGDTEIDLSDYYNKTETDTLLSGKVDKVNGKGLSTNDYTTAEKTKLAGIEAGAEVNPTSGAKTATDTFTTVNGGLLSKCMIDLVPVQSGSGDPYPAGGGKNKCYTVLSNIKTSNTSGTWSGNTYTYDSMTFKVLEDDGGNIIGISVNGTNNLSGDMNFFIINRNSGTAYYLPDNNYDLNGCPSGGGSTTYQIRFQATRGGSIYNCGVDTGSGAANCAVLSTDRLQVVINIKSGTTISNKVFTPMIRLSTETDPTFAPYSNVRPISGHTEVDLYNVGKNRCSFWKNGYMNSSGFFVSSNVNGMSNIIPLKNGEKIIYSSSIVGSGTGLAVFANSDLTSMLTRKNAWDTLGTPSYITYTATSDCYAIVWFNLDNATTVTQDIYNSVQLQIEFVASSVTTPTSYEPYLGHLYQVQIGSTVYGGYVDLVSGVMVATWAWVDLGTLTWAYNTSRTRFEANLSDIKYNADRYHLMMPNYKFFQGSPNDMPDFNYTCSNNSTGIYVKNSLYGNDTASFIASMTGYIGVYELATPQTIQLTPQQIETLAGQNNLSTPLDGQSIETNGVEYKELFTFADVKEYVKPLIPYSNAGSHNAIYRGKYLGDHVTPEQWASIVAGTFDDLFIGDYWIINSVTWRIAHFDYWLGTGDTECTTPHVVIVPDTNLYTAKMNSTDTTSGGYYNSEMRGGANYLVSGSSNLYSASETIKSAFGSSHILTHRERLTNAVSSGNASGSAWYDSSVDLMSEVMVYGVLAWSVGGKGYEVGDGKGQFALFVHDISRVTNHANWWLRGVSSATDFVHDGYNGVVSINPASYSFGVRPCFAIK